MTDEPKQHQLVLVIEYQDPQVPANMMAYVLGKISGYLEAHPPSQRGPVSRCAVDD
jgi:hypothetical protein